MNKQGVCIPLYFPPFLTPAYAGFSFNVTFPFLIIEGLPAIRQHSLLYFLLTSELAPIIQPLGITLPFNTRVSVPNHTLSPITIGFDFLERILVDKSIVWWKSVSITSVFQLDSTLFPNEILLLHITVIFDVFSKWSPNIRWPFSITHNLLPVPKWTRP